MYKARLKEKYHQDIAPELKRSGNYKSVMAVPKLEKITVNAGLGRILRDGGDDFKNILEDFSLIVGQKPVVTKAKKSIATFKLREGMPVGMMVTLRGDKMYEFLDRLTNVVMPQVRDFRGVKKTSFDRHGNYNIGLREHIVFPEVVRDNIRTIFGLEITITTSANTDAEAYQLLKAFGLPIVDKIVH